MNDPLHVHEGAERVQAIKQVQQHIERIERRVADAVRSTRPGREGAQALHAEIDLVLNTDSLATAGSFHRRTLIQMKGARARGNVIDEALQETTQAHLDALGQAGIPASVLELLQSWVEVTVDARVMQRQLELNRATGSVQGERLQYAPSPVAEDPAEPLSAAELGQALGGLSDETVRQRERAGELFSILRAGRKRGREYPAFQAWAGIAGQPLAKALTALGAASATGAYGFFTAPTDLLGGLTPIEALLGRLTTQRALDAETQNLLAASADERLQAVVKAAEAHSAMLAA